MALSGGRPCSPLHIRDSHRFPGNFTAEVQIMRRAPVYAGAVVLRWIDNVK